MLFFSSFWLLILFLNKIKIPVVIIIIIIIINSLVIKLIKYWLFSLCFVDLATFLLLFFI
jgi:hypothetical protein